MGRNDIFQSILARNPAQALRDFGRADKSSPNQQVERGGQTLRLAEAMEQTPIDESRFAEE
jgi:hypothetical protein